MNYDNPFPGMNPYLEDPGFWPEVHNGLIALLWASLGPELPSNYRLAINEWGEVSFAPPEERGRRVVIPDLTIAGSSGADGGVLLKEPPAPADSVLVTIPASDEARVTYLEVRAVASERVVTVVEVLSPTNKMPGVGRSDYLIKRGNILASGASLVEIDLLRGGERMPVTPADCDCHYSILVSKEWLRPYAFLFPFAVTEAIPRFRLPLLPEDAEPEVAIGPLLDRMHHTARYNSVAGYDGPPPGPALRPDVQRWVEARLELFRRPA